MKFYIANGKAKEKLLDLDLRRWQVMKDRNAMYNEFGAKGGVERNDYLAGFVFDVKPVKPWVLNKKLSKYVPNVYSPNASKVGKEIRRRMDGLVNPVNHFSVSEAVEIDGFEFVFSGRFKVSEFTILCGKVVVAIDDRAGTPKECKRISDMEYEKLLATARKKKGKAT